MSTNNNEKQLKRCLEETVLVIKTTIDRLQPSTISQSDTTSISSVVNNMNTFTLNVEDDEAMDELKTRLENVFKKHLPYLSSNFQNYVKSFLCQYDYDDRRGQFKNCLSVGILHPLCRGFQSLSESIDAFNAAWEGKLSTVQKFIEKYPSVKNKPGHWGTTLLYSAARNGHMKLVEYLIETAKCSVNAQNEQDLAKCLESTKTTAYGYEFRSKDASTALHGACFQGHSQIVQYLVEHGADYFIRNQALETPLMNIRNEGEIKQYFRNYLLLGYLKTLSGLPDKPILEETRPIVDCVWEYKSLNDKEWHSSLAEESKELQQSLLVTSDQQFKTEIRLTESDEIYTISTIQFLRSGQNPTENHNLDWIRCRGSSILNFDCYSIWQIMLLKHPEADSDTIPSLKIFDIPIVDDITFKIQLHSWYNCDAKTNSRIDHAMNYRQKLLQLNLDFITEKTLIFNLQTFAFANNKKTITGFIRWIPKLISNSEQDRNRIKILDNFGPITNLIPIPLTTNYYDQVMQQGDQNSLRNDELSDDENGDDGTAIGFTNDLDEDDDHSQTKSSDSGVYTIDDIENDDAETSTTTIRHEREQDSTDDSSAETIDDYLNPKADNVEPLVPTKEVESEEVVKEILESVRSEMNELKAFRDHEKQKIQRLDAIDELQGDLYTAIQKVESLNEKLDEMKRKKEEIKQIADTIQTIQYTKIEKHLLHDFLVPKHQLIVNQLQRQTKKLDDYFIDKIPKMVFDEKRNTFTIILTGLQVHHRAFKEILQRILTLAKAKQRAIEFYQRHLNRITTSINRILFQIKPSTNYWKQYSKIFYELLKIENARYWEKFKDLIELKIKEISEEIIVDHSVSPWTMLRRITDSIMKENPFENEIERLKYQAFEKFIELNISVQQLKLAKKPTKESRDTLQHFIERTKKIFQEDPKYIGYEKQHLSLIPPLLQRLMIYYCCFTLQLPLYESSQELLREIKKNTVITISTSTGSGKSTLLPALLIAAGYDKVLVTQPRRLPCKLISKRVNETMISDRNRFGGNLAGWAVSGDEDNARAKILYLTDGLLKERLLKDENFITNQTTITKSIVLFIDEVHERSANIDLCLALIARMLTNNQSLITKLKVIISSATLDSSVPSLFTRISNVKLYKFEMPSMGTLYPVKDIKRPDENILDVVKEILAKRERKDQVLCFVSSTFEVNRCCKLLNELSQNTIVAYPLIQAQSPREQEEALDKGSIFFSTTVAETSLTFSSLKYVVDTGMINVSTYDIRSRHATLSEVRAANSTIQQRRGRLGRTQPGEYYILYRDVPRKPYPTPQICQSDLMSIEFSLRISPLKISLDQMKEFLPDKPRHEAIFFVDEELIRLKILKSGSSGRLTDYGESLAKLPDFGSLPMSRCVLAALQDFNCGRDLICLASILSVINTTAVLKRVPPQLKSCDGDFMTLLNIMNAILLTKQSVLGQKFDLDQVCRAKGLVPVQPIIRQALKRYSTLEKSFDLSDDYRGKAQIKCDDWELIAKALLVGYSNNVFVSKKDLQGRTHRFIRYNDTQDTTAVLDIKSTLMRSIKVAPVSLVLARDILYLPTTIRLTAIISFLGEIKADWIRHEIRREIKLNDAEHNHLKGSGNYSRARTIFSKEDVTIDLGSHILNLKGPAGGVLKAEIYLLQELILTYSHKLENKYSSQNENLARNLDSVRKMTHIFRPMVWRWEAQKQIKITVNGNTATKTCEVSIRGKDSDVKTVLKEFTTFQYWLQNCVVIRHPNAGVSPRLLRAQMRVKCADIEARIARITDEKRSPIDLYNNVKGRRATRETRMEVVAWIIVCLCDCKLEGGFVRDWVVGKYAYHPQNIDPKDWVEYHTNSAGERIPSILEEVVPRDLDCHLPTHAEFDSDKFQDELYKFGITCEIKREEWRYVVLVDFYAPTGPFTMDLIEPHVTLTHDRIDLDVNNLVLEKNYTRDLGMRIDIQQKPYSIDLETIVENIKNKRFRVLRPIDEFVEKRVKKMVNIRHWEQIEQPMSVIPNPDPKYNAVLVLLHHSSALYQIILHQMQRIDANIQIVSIEEIKNPDLEEMYEGMKKVITRQCPGGLFNQRELFHGTSGDGIDGIVKHGFDDRFFNRNGFWGHGAYFADDPRKSHNYADPDANNTRVMFYNKVLLGVESIFPEFDRTLQSAPVDCHSVRGTRLEYTEYIIYRFGQALPYLKIIYSV